MTRAIAMNGTCTGEHGAPAVELMRALKRAIDPLDITKAGRIAAV